MTRQINIGVGDGETPDVINLSGIPADIWNGFTDSATKQFPDKGELAWASYLSEVIVAASGQSTEVTSYFLTKVPIAYAQALAGLLAQIGTTWTEFHSMLLRSSIDPGKIRLANFRNSGHTGTFILTGVDPAIFTAIEEVTGKSFEQVMATVILAGGAKQLTFGEGTVFVEPTKSE